MEVKVEENLKLVNFVAKKYIGKIEYDDLFQIGCLGLVKAANKYDGRCEFSTYAVPMIDGEIKRYFRDHTSIKIPRSASVLKNKISWIRTRYELLGKEINIKEIAKKINADLEDVEACINSQWTYSLNTKAPENKDTEFLDFIEDLQANTEYEVINKISYEEMTKELDSEEKWILENSIDKTLSQEEMADILGRNQVWISRKLKKIYQKIGGGIKVQNKRIHSDSVKTKVYEWLDSLPDEEVVETKEVIEAIEHRYHLSSSTSTSYFYKWKRDRRMQNGEVKSETTLCDFKVEEAKDDALKNKREISINIKDDELGILEITKDKIQLNNDDVMFTFNTKGEFKKFCDFIGMAFKLQEKNFN